MNYVLHTNSKFGRSRIKLRAKELPSEKSSPDTSSRSHGKPEEEEKGERPNIKVFKLPTRREIFRRIKKFILFLLDLDLSNLSKSNLLN